MTAETPFEILKTFGLLSWKVLSIAWQHEWITKRDLEEYATKQLASEIDDVNLTAIASLASANQLNDSEIAQLLKPLSAMEDEPPETALTKWRLARLLEIREAQLDWDQKVTRLEEVAAEFGFPPDMQRCSRYVTDDKSPYSDPLNEMQQLIVNLKKQFGIQ